MQHGDEISLPVVRTASPAPSVKVFARLAFAHMLLFHPFLAEPKPVPKFKGDFKAEG